MRSKKRLEPTVRDLEERVKELQCLYTVSALAQRPNLPPEALFQGVAGALERAYQYPDLTRVRITVQGQVHTGGAFEETPWRQVATLVLDGEAAGTLEVFYSEACPPADTGPFLREEQALLDSVAQILSTSLEAERERIARRLSEASALRHAQEFRTLAENFPEVIFRFDRTLRHIYVNPAVEQFAGLPRQSVLGSTNAELGLPEDIVARWDARLLDVFESGREQRLEFSMFCPAGERHFESRLIPEPGPDGEVHTVLNVLHEQTSHVKAENLLIELGAALQARNAELEQANRQLKAANAELEKFTSVVSHDLKAPLRAVHGLSSWIEEEVNEHLSEDGRRRMQLLRERIRSMDELINALLDYSRAGGERFEIEEVATAELVNTVIGNQNVPDGFSISVAPDLPTLRTDRLHLQQVFANLIGNAIEHHDRADGHVWISARESGEFVEFAVTDDGPGIAPQHYQCIFDIFQRLDPSKGTGTGIGLAIVKKVIERAGGQIHVESVPGESTAFRFTWPKVTEPKTA